MYPQAPTSKFRNVLLPVLLSLVNPGSVQISLGLIKRGIIMALLPLIGLAGFQLTVFQSALLMQFFKYFMVVGFLILIGDAIVKTFQLSGVPHRKAPWYFTVICFCLNASLWGAYKWFSNSESFVVPASSMSPNINVGDHFMGDKRSQTLGNLTKGDIIVFKYPEDPTVKLVKRIIGTAGDKLEMKGKVIFVNGKPLEQVDAQKIESEAALEIPHFKEKRSDVVIKREIDFRGAHLIAIEPKSTYSENFALLTVPLNNYFVMGDNRDNSKDSRFFGFVAQDQVVAKLVYKY